MIQFILILHLIGDFYFQFNKIAHCKVGLCDNSCGDCLKCKDKKFINVKYLLIHLLLYILPFGMLFHFMKWYYCIAVIASVFGVHFIIDSLTCLCKKYSKIPSSLVFAADQALHLVSLVGIYHIFNSFISENNFVTNNMKIVNVVLCVVILIAPAMQFIKCVMSDCFGNQGETKEKIGTKEFDAGKLIGIIERLLILIFFYLEAYSTIAIIITLKTWARSNDIKEIKGFGNKYLVGTLLSFLLAALCGIAILNIVK